MPKSTAATLCACLLIVFGCVARGQDADRALERWGQVVDPAHDCNFECVADKLSISVPGTHHGLNPTPSVNNMLAPRMLREIDGDFSIEVVVESFLQPEAHTYRAHSGVGAVEAGLLLWQDEKNFICWTRATEGERARVHAHLAVVFNGAAFSRTYSASDAPLSLKIFRENGRINVALSEDGQLWQMPRYSSNNFILSTFSDTLQCGVVAINATDQVFQAEFRNLAIAQEPHVAIHRNLPTDMYLPVNAFPLLEDRKVQHALRLDEGTVARIAELMTEQRSLAKEVEKAADRKAILLNKSQTNWAEIKDQLSESQTERLAGLAIQAYSHRSLLIDCVCDRLKLDTNQQAAIAEAIAELEQAAKNTTPLDENASESKSQQLKSGIDAKLRKLVDLELRQRMSQRRGEPFEFTLGGQVEFSTLVKFHPLGAEAAIVSFPAVQRELQLSSLVRKSLSQFLDEQSLVAIELVQNLPPLENPDKPSEIESKAWNEIAIQLALLRSQLENELREKLTPKQLARLQGLLVQTLGAQALRLSDLASESFSWTDKQAEQLQNIRDAALHSYNIATITGQRVINTSPVDAILTSEQKQKLEATKGSPLLAYPK